MTRARVMLIIVALITAASLAGLRGMPRSQVKSQEPGAAKGAVRGPFCSQFPGQTVLQVGPDETTEPKRVSKACSWQFRVPYLRGFLDEFVEWDLCNACETPIEFAITGVEPDLLNDCFPPPDASGTTRVRVEAHSIQPIRCRGAKTGFDSYFASARAIPDGRPVQDDPEIVIEDRYSLPVDSSLAQTGSVTQCITNTGPDTVSVTFSGQFSPRRAGSSVVFIPAPPGRFGTAFGGDLVEVAPRGGPPAPDGPKVPFTAKTQIPAFATSNFTLRDSQGPKTIKRDDFKRCSQ